MRKKDLKNKEDKEKWIFLPIVLGGWEINFPSFNERFSSVEGIVGFVVDVLNFLVGASAVVAVGLIIYGGITYMTAGGDSENVKKATNILTATVIGLCIVFLARMLIKFVLDTFLL
ncbi:MAG TPA: pilin [Candidatus Dojkabacteria bacterium]|jgi:hypothetical protein|nr:pilin [Candidatus Dojkabacteria bacterium]HQA87767.1 pilin [Candidatus Dojkabacteria bacterium]